MPLSELVPMRRIAAATVSFALLAAAPALAAEEHPVPAAVPTTPSAAFAPDRVIVVWEAGASRADRLDARADADTTFVRTLGDPRFQLLRTEPGQAVGDALATLRDDPDVHTAVHDSLDVPHATTNDPLLNQLWGLQNLGAPVHGVAAALAGADVDALAAWDRTRGTPWTVIADLDSGYRFDHPDLGPVAWTNPVDPPDGADNDGNGIIDDSHGADFVGGSANTPATDGDPTDDDLVDGGHGVHTAGTMGAAGNNGIGISGVAQDVRIMPLRVCSAYVDPRGNSGTSCPTSSQILAINYAGSHGARAANMSLGGTTFNGALLAALAANPQVLFVISAGNDAQDNEQVPHYPCGYDPSTSGVAGAVDNIVCVAATDQADALAGFSDWGARSVDVGAPGTETLSTYPYASVADETFSVDDFAAKWSATGADGGFTRTNEVPLTSFGMSDSPGVAPVARSVHESTSVAVTIPPGYPSCRLTQTRTVSLGGGTYTYSVLVDGSVIDSNSPTTSGTFFLDVSDPRLAAGGRLQLRFSYTAGAAPTAANGVWLDDISLVCTEPLGQAQSYGFLEGTSMAAPHVTGAAGLLFSLNPTASVAQVRAALLATVDPVAALAGKTTTGGRIDIATALDEIRQPDTAITSKPSASTRARSAAFGFVRLDSTLATSFECQLDGGVFAACTSPTSYSRLTGGRHTFAVRAKSPRGIVTDASPASVSWSVTECQVPRLKGKSLRRAKRALRRAHCKTGRVKRPRGGRRPFVIRSSKPRAGAVRVDGTKVRLKLGSKPRPRRHHGRRR